jgi:hypothetical protein
MLVAACCAVLAIVAGPVAAAGKADAPGPDAQVVNYKGKLVDEAGKAISGIFPMTFKLVAGLKSNKAVWSESMWVAVDRGIYRVRLGESKRLPTNQDLSKHLLAVEVRGLGEISREPFGEDSNKVFSPAPQGAAGPAASPRQQGGVKFADSAGFAVEADHAKNADRLQNLTVEDLTRKILEEGGGGGGGKAKIGATKRFGNRVGGPGGTSEYNEVCPKGYVMTGVKGGAGIYLDSIQIICSPLE